MTHNSRSASCSSRAAATSRIKEKQAAVMHRALDAYRSVQTKEYVVAVQQQRVDAYKKKRQADSAADQALYKSLKRVIEKEEEKLAQFKDRGDDTVTAKIKCGQIFSQLGKNDEARLLLSIR